MEREGRERGGHQVGRCKRPWGVARGASGAHAVRDGGRECRRAQGQHSYGREESTRLLGDGGRAARVADAEDGIHPARAKELEGGARHGEEPLVDGGRGFSAVAVEPQTILLSAVNDFGFPGKLLSREICQSDRFITVGGDIYIYIYI